jgi:hypothetical protein
MKPSPALRRSRKRVVILAAALAAALTAACDRGTGAPGRGGIDFPQLRAEPDLAIGSMEGEEAYVFGRVSGLARDDAGRIYVADLHAHEVRVFGEDGEHRFTLGRRGGGPGELSSPCCLAFGPDGLLWVRDNGNARYVAFEVSEQNATAVATQRMSHSDANRHVATTFDEAGRLVDVGMRPDPATGEARTTRFHVRPGGDVEKEVSAPLPPDPEALVYRVPVRFGDATTGIRYFYQPYGPRHLVAHGPGGMHADAVSSRYHVRWYLEDGNLLRVVELPGESGPALTTTQRTRADSMIAADARVAGTAMPFSPPQRHPPLAALRFDQDGRLWVQRTVLPGEPNRADVYGRDGERVATVEFPAGFDLGYGVLRSDMLLGVMRDELGVEYVVRMRMEETDAEPQAPSLPPR